MLTTDDAGIFSVDAKKQAQEKMSAAKFNRSLHFNVDTYKNPPADVQKEYENASEKAKFGDEEVGQVESRAATRRRGRTSSSA